MKTLINQTTKKAVVFNELNLKNTLINGQAFNWEPLNEDCTKFIGVFRKNIIIFQHNFEKKVIEYQEIPKNEEINQILHDYFQLDVNIEQLINEEWSKDSYFKKISANFRGLRILRQDPFECLISFICSQNNNIPRITKILKAIRSQYGDLIPYKQHSQLMYSFPSIEQLSKATESDFQKLGLGYRANYLFETIQSIKQMGGESYLYELRNIKKYQEIREKLLQFKGVGNKVADCVALFSLNCTNAIPVDTHIWQIYNKQYGSNKDRQKKENMTLQGYNKISQFFQDKFGEHAGWAHSYLFTADLNQFKNEATGKSFQKEDSNLLIQQKQASALSDKDQPLEKEEQQQKPIRKIKKQKQTQKPSTDFTQITSKKKKK